MILGIVDDIVIALLKLLILLVAGIYKLVSGFYQIFLILSRTNIFDQDTYQHLTDKVYVILAVVMLFVLAYNFITLIIDPDKNKGGSVVEKIIKNAVTSLILIVICPTLFSFAFDLQDAILNQGVITKFFTIDNPVTGKPYDAATSIQEGGNMMAAYTFKAFFAPAHDGDNAGNITNKGKGKNYNGANCGSKGGCTLAQAEAYAEKTGTFGIYTAFAANWHESDAKMGVDFSFLMAIIAGFYLIYVIISFCFDLAVRVIKLAFYQIIAPICIACRILPDKESIFKNWWKAVVKTYLSVFIRIFIMNMAVFLMILITDDDQLIPSVCPTCSLSVRLLAYAFLIMGLLMFVKQSTKLIDEIFQLGDVNLGIASKLKEGGAFTAGAAIGAGVTATARNISHAVSNVHAAQGGKAKAGAIFRGIGQTLTGSVRGTYNGAKSGWNAGSYKDMQKAASEGAKTTIDQRDVMEHYRQEHNLGGLKGTMPVIGGIAVAAHKIKDKALDVVDWAGVNNTSELMELEKQTKTITDAYDAVKDKASDALVKDATVKHKHVTYGIDQTKQFTYSYTDEFGVTHTIAPAAGQEMRYNSATYDSMDQLLKQARATGASNVTFHGETIETGIFESMMSNFKKKMSEEMATVASRSDKEWERYINDTSVSQAVRNQRRQEKRDLDGVIAKSQDLRIILETNASSTVVQAANKLGAGGQQITGANVHDVQLDFTGGAVSKLGDAGKDVTSDARGKLNARNAQKAKAGNNSNK